MTGRLGALVSWILSLSLLSVLVVVPGSALALPEPVPAQTGTWRPVGDLNTPRLMHTATLLQDGNVLAVGGYNWSAPFGVTSVERYDRFTGEWSAVAPLATARYAHAAELLRDGRVLVTGGTAQSGDLKSCEVYDPVTESWSGTGALNTARSFHTATVLADGRVLVAGGGGVLSPLASAEVYDPASGQWTATGDLNGTRTLHTATLLPDGQVLVAGGVGEGAQTAEIYDPSTGIWSETTWSMQVSRGRHTAVYEPETGDVFVIAGQNDSGDYLQHVEYYDIGSGSWYTIDALETGRFAHTATLIPGFGPGPLVVGGYGDTGYLASAEVLNIDGNWIAASPLSTARYWHSATLLMNGDLLVTGGMNDSGPLVSTEKFSYDRGNWMPTGPLGTPRRDFTVTELPDGTILLVGGETTEGYTASVEHYDRGTNTWTPAADLAIPRAKHTATLLDWTLLVVGGVSVSGETASVEVFDILHNEWAPGNSLATRRSDHTATIMADGRVLVAGGYNVDDGCLASAEIFDPEDGAWTPTGAMHTARARHRATLILGFFNFVVVTAGDDCAGGELRSVERYNPHHRVWIPSRDLIRGRAGHSVTSLPSGKLLVAGGYSSVDGILDTLEEYDPELDEWQEVASLDTERQGHGASLLPDGRVLFAGGESDAGATTSVEVYDPPSGAMDRLMDTLTGHLNASIRQLTNGHSGIFGYDSSPEIFDPWAGGGTMDVRADGTGAGMHSVASAAGAEAMALAGGSSLASDGKPVLDAVTDPLTLGSSLQVTGTGFLGLSEGSGGRAMDSGTNYPLIQLRRLETEQMLVLPVDTAVGFSDSSFTSVPVVDFPVGFAYVTAFVNGVASEAKIIRVVEPPVWEIYLPVVLRQ
jgi:N-acetylneuraminic acid mutarotase